MKTETINLFAKTEKKYLIRPKLKTTHLMSFVLEFILVVLTTKINSNIKEAKATSFTLVFLTKCPPSAGSEVALV